MIEQSVSDELFRGRQVVAFDEVVEVLRGSLSDSDLWILRQRLDTLLR